MARVGVVVLSFERKDLTLACLRSLLATRLRDARVLVVDNASTDGAVEAVRAAFPSVEVVQNARNLGFGGGMNVGARRHVEAGCDHVLLLNNDTAFPDADFLAKLVAALEADPKVALAGPRVVSLETGRTVFGGPSKDRYGTLPLFGAAILARGDWLRAHGLFDPAFFLYFEDRDLFRRVEAAGRSVHYVDDAVVAHSERSPSSGGHLSATKLHHWNRSFVLYARRHLTPAEAARALAADRLRVLPWQTKEIIRARDAAAWRGYWSGYVEGWKAARRVG
ncbi:MAG TPA: glycosyltransferase family 2 protein [Candidatus Thermoplasmatota archaeon]|nr:glycosyltransferase family 2 protein [Candidatus Thermoplasmatota archaeon]